MIPGTINGAVVLDSRISLQYSEPWNRPSQPVEAMSWLGETQVNVIQWFGEPGITIGFTRPNARTALASAITETQHAGDTDIPAGQMWVTQAYHDNFAQAIADAKAAYDNHSLTNDEYDGALYHLAQAHGAPATLTAHRTTPTPAAATTASGSGHSPRPTWGPAQATEADRLRRKWTTARPASRSQRVWGHVPTHVAPDHVTRPRTNTRAARLVPVHEQV